MRSVSLFLLALSAVSCVLVNSNGEQMNYPSKPEGNFRLLQFSDSKAEWISQQLLDSIIDGTLEQNPTLISQVSKEVLSVLTKENRGWGPGYVDLTDSYLENSMGISSSLFRDTIPNYPTPNPSKYPFLNKYFQMVSAQNLRQTVEDMSGIFTRFYKSSMSTKAPTLIQSKVNAIIKAAKATDIKVSLMNNNGFNQPNVIAILPAKGSSDKSQQVIVIGGHLDSVVQGSGPDGRAPGADDDASGSALVMEAFRILVSSGYRGSRPIHFMWFAAEEGGLLGSQTVAQTYKSKGINVWGMLQMEMCGYQKNTNAVVTVLNDPNPAFSSWTHSLIGAYLPALGTNVTLNRSNCGYGCSDHNSFDDAGFPAGVVSEAGPYDKGLNPYMHTTKDTPSQLNWDAMVPFVRVALSWLVELSY